MRAACPHAQNSRGLLTSSKCAFTSYYSLIAGHLHYARGGGVGRGRGVGVVRGSTVAVGVAVAVAVAVGVGLAQGGGVVSSSTVLTVVVDVLRPSATSTRPSGSVPCACAARLPSMAGPAPNVPLPMVKMWVALVGLKPPSAPSVINSWPVPKGEMPP